MRTSIHNYSRQASGCPKSKVFDFFIRKIGTILHVIFSMLFLFMLLYTAMQIVPNIPTMDFSSWEAWFNSSQQAIEGAIFGFISLVLFLAYRWFRRKIRLAYAKDGIWGIVQCVLLAIAAVVLFSLFSVLALGAVIFYIMASSFSDSTEYTVDSDGNMRRLDNYDYYWW